MGGWFSFQIETMRRKITNISELWLRLEQSKTNYYGAFVELKSEICGDFHIIFVDKWLRRCCISDKRFDENFMHYAFVQTEYLVLPQLWMISQTHFPHEIFLSIQVKLNFQKLLIEAINIKN